MYVNAKEQPAQPPNPEPNFPQSLVNQLLVQRPTRNAILVPRNDILTPSRLGELAMQDTIDHLQPGHVLVHGVWLPVVEAANGSRIGDDDDGLARERDSLVPTV